MKTNNQIAEEIAKNAWFYFADKQYGPDKVSAHEQSQYKYYLEEKSQFRAAFSIAFNYFLAEMGDKQKQIDRLRAALVQADKLYADDKKRTEVIRAALSTLEEST